MATYSEWNEILLLFKYVYIERLGESGYTLSVRRPQPHKAITHRNKKEKEKAGSQEGRVQLRSTKKHWPSSKNPPVSHHRSRRHPDRYTDHTPYHLRLQISIPKWWHLKKFSLEMDFLVDLWIIASGSFWIKFSVRHKAKCHNVFIQKWNCYLHFVYVLLEI